MLSFNVGDRVSIPCSLQPGAVKGEFLVTVESDEGEISGFVKEAFTVRYGSNAFVVGSIEAVNPDRITVRIPGSFFRSASGRTSIRSDWASSNLLRYPIT